MDKDEFDASEVFRRITTCPTVGKQDKNGYPRPWCIRYPPCEKGCCVLCKENCDFKCGRAVISGYRR